MEMHVGGYSRWRYPQPCPSCGHCPTCGHLNWPWPMYPPRYPPTGPVWVSDNTNTISVENGTTN